MKHLNYLGITISIAATAFVMFSTSNARAGVENCVYIDKNRFPTEYKACVAGEISAPETSSEPTPNAEEIVDGSETPGKNCHFMDVKVVKTAWNKSCGKNSLFIKAKNVSSSNARVKICIEQKTGIWDCGSEGPMKPGKTTHYWSCNPTGRYIIQSYEHNKDVYSCFPSNKDTGKPKVLDFAIRRVSR